MKMQFKIVFILPLLTATNGYKILGMFTHPGKSHFDFFQPLMRALAEKGHQVTVLSYFPQKNHIPNYTDISLFNPTEYLSLNSINIQEYDPFYGIIQLLVPTLIGHLSIKVCEDILKQDSVKNLFQDNNHFDLVMTEYFSDRCLYNLAEKYKAPLIGMSSCTPFSFLDKPLGYPSSPSYIPNVFSSYGGKMTFMERVYNTLLYLYIHVIYNVILPCFNNRLINKHIGDQFSSVEDVHANSSLMLVNTHFSFTDAKPLPPDYVEVSGLHIGKFKHPPAHLEKWINESTHGVVYFSLGSMIKGHTFPDEKKQMFLNAFKRIPQRVLWKWENETMPGKPDNVMIDKWMPQLDVLCHPNVKGFISHGGLLGATEGVHCGVPMIIMPQFGDQFTNAKAVETSGGGVIVDYRNLDEESIYEALTTILSPDFNKQVKELSARFKDRPLPPLETAIYWVEYVARHRGAPHLKTAAVGMPLYQYLLLDVIAFLAVILFSFIFIIYYITRALFRRLCKSGKASAKLKKN